MNKKIKILTVQTVDGEKASFTTTVSGTLENNGTAKTVRYTQENENGGISTEINIGKSFVTIKNNGSSGMIIEPGKSHPCEYATPYGVFPLIVKGIAFDTSEKGGIFRLKLKYRLFNAGQEISINEITLIVQSD